LADVVVASVNASPASAERLIFRRCAETDHDHSMNAITRCTAASLMKTQSRQHEAQRLRRDRYWEVPKQNWRLLYRGISLAPPRPFNLSYAFDLPVATYNVAGVYLRLSSPGDAILI